MNKSQYEKYFKGYSKELGRPIVYVQESKEFLFSIFNNIFFKAYDNTGLKIEKDGFNMVLGHASQYANFIRSNYKIKMVVKLLINIVSGFRGKVKLDNTNIIHLENFGSDHRHQKFIKYCKAQFGDKYHIICETSTDNIHIHPNALQFKRYKLIIPMFKTFVQCIYKLVTVRKIDILYLLLHNLRLQQYKLKIEEIKHIHYSVVYCGYAPFANMLIQYCRLRGNTTFEIAHGWVNPNFLPIKTNFLCTYHESDKTILKKHGLKKDVVKNIGQIYLSCSEDITPEDTDDDNKQLGIVLTNADDIKNSLIELFKILIKLEISQIIAREHPLEKGQLNKIISSNIRKEINIHIDSSNNPITYFSKLYGIIGYDSSILLDAASVGLPVYSLNASPKFKFNDVTRFNGITSVYPNYTIVEQFIKTNRRSPANLIKPNIKNLFE